MHNDFKKSPAKVLNLKEFPFIVDQVYLSTLLILILQNQSHNDDNGSVSLTTKHMGWGMHARDACKNSSVHSSHAAGNCKAFMGEKERE